MGSSQSLWAITGNEPRQNEEDVNDVYEVQDEEDNVYENISTIGLLPGLEDLVTLDSFKIEGKFTLLGSLSSSYKVNNSDGQTIYRAQHVSSSDHVHDSCTVTYKEVFRVSDSLKRGVLRVFKCYDGLKYDTSSFPGVLIGFVKIKETHSRPLYQLWNDEGEPVLDIKPASNKSYQLFSQAGSCRVGAASCSGSLLVGEFCRRTSLDGIKGNFPREMDVRIKAGVLLVALVACRKKEKQDEVSMVFNVIKEGIITGASAIINN